MIDLLKLLKPGDKVFSIIHGKILKIRAIDQEKELSIDLGQLSFNRHGSILPSGTDCLIFPSEEEKTWANYSPFKKGEIVLVFNDQDDDKVIGVFSHREHDLNYIFKQLRGKEFLYEGFKNCEYAEVTHFLK